MTNVKRCMLIVLSVLLSFSSVIMVFSSKTYAKSKYDDAYQTTSELILSDGIQNRCSKENITYSWDTYFDHEKYKMYDSFSNKDQLKKKLDDARASFNRAKISGVYGVTLNKSVGVVGSGKRAVNIYWSEDKSAELEWTEGFLNIKNVYVLSITCGKEFEQGTNKYVSMVSYPDKTSTVVSASDELQLNFFITGKDFEYPEGYEGKKLYATPDIKTSLSPDFKYDLNGMNLSATDYKKDLPKVAKDSDIGYYKWTILWSVFICPDGFDDKTGVCSGEGSAYDIKYMNQEDTFTYTFDKKGDYALAAEYVPMFCVREVLNGSPCHEASLAEMAGKEYAKQYRLRSKHVHLKVDGSIQSGDTRNAECFDTGYCKPASEYEDCSKFVAWDKVVDLVGCWTRNVLIWFLSFIKWLIVPSTSDLQRSVNDLGKTLSGKLGFLWYPFEWILKLFTQFTRSADTCSFGVAGIPFADIDGRFFGTRVHLSVCSAERDLPQVYNVSVFFVRIVTVFGLLYALYRRVIAMLSVDQAISFARGDHK